jgi:hypothetical protein
MLAAFSIVRALANRTTALVVCVFWSAEFFTTETTETTEGSSQ